MKQQHNNMNGFIVATAHNMNGNSNISGRENRGENNELF